MKVTDIDLKKFYSDNKHKTEVLQELFAEVGKKVYLDKAPQIMTDFFELAYLTSVPGTLLQRLRAGANNGMEDLQNMPINLDSFKISALPALEDFKKTLEEDEILKEDSPFKEMLKNKLEATTKTIIGLIDFTKDESQKLYKDFREKTETVEILDQKRQALAQKTFDLETKKDILQKEMEGFNSILSLQDQSEYQKNLASLKEQHSKIMTQLNEFTEKENDNHEFLNKTKQDIGFLEKSKQALEAKNKIIEQQLLSSSNKKPMSEKEIGELKTNLTKNLENQSQLKKDIDSQKLKIQKSEDLLASLFKKENEFQESLNKEEKETQYLKITKVTAIEENIPLATKLVTSNGTEKANLQQKFQNNIEFQHQLDNNIATSMQKSKSLSQELAKIKIEKNESQEFLNLTKKTIQSLEEQDQDLNVKNKDLEQKILANNELESLKANFLSNKQQSDKLMQSIMDLNQKNIDITKLLESLKESKTQSSQLLETISKKSDLLQEQNKNSIAQRKFHEEKVKNLNDDVKAIDLELKNTEQEFHNTRKEIEETKKLIPDVKEIDKKSQELVAQLNKDIKTKIENLNLQILDELQTGAKEIKFSLNNAKTENKKISDIERLSGAQKGYLNMVTSAMNQNEKPDISVHIGDGPPKTMHLLINKIDLKPPKPQIQSMEFDLSFLKGDKFQYGLQVPAAKIYNVDFDLTKGTVIDTDYMKKITSLIDVQKDFIAPYMNEKYNKKPYKNVFDVFSESPKFKEEVSKGLSDEIYKEVKSTIKNNTISKADQAKLANKISSIFAPLGQEKDQAQIKKESETLMKIVAEDLGAKRQMGIFARISSSVKKVVNNILGRKKETKSLNQIVGQDIIKQLKENEQMLTNSKNPKILKKPQQIQK